VPATPPNILWIITTQWRAQACGYAGDPNARTPHLDALAAESIDFTQAVTPHPFGPFARAALLTGVPSPQNGVRDYFDPLPREARTVAHALRGRGYVTAFFGKWHLGERDRRAPLVGEAHAKTIVPPEARGGFEVWDGFEGGFLLNDPWFHGTELATPEKITGYQSDVVCERAAAWIARFSAGQRVSEGKPWFAVVSLEPPHPPYDAPAGDIPERDPALLELSPNVPRGGEAEARARRELAGYYAHIEATDRALVRILFPRAKRDDAAIVFTSAHGDMHGAHGLFRKGWPYEESVRVPLLVRCPMPGRGAACGVRSSALVSLLDVYRWTIGWADGDEAQIPNSAPAPLSSSHPRSVQRISMPSVVALPHQCDRVWRGVRTASRKLVVNDDGSPWLFFDLVQDPGEQRNRVSEPSCRAEITRLAGELNAAAAPADERPTRSPRVSTE
jgi:arylsulfatase A-like enzyme